MSSSFFVHIVESVGPNDVLECRSEAETLCQILRLAEIGAARRTVLDRTSFVEALKAIYSIILEDPRLQDNPQPVLHLSAHGDATGVALTNGESLTWDDLGCLLAPINQSCGGRLLVCMSSCEGFMAWKMARRPGGLKPFWGLLGPQRLSAGRTPQSGS